MSYSTLKNKPYKIDYNIPVLYVNENEGFVSYLPFSFRRTSDNTSLRISISDDTPSGSGKEIRDNLWLAAVTAAMLRNETMHGVKISVEFSGNVDGPSAGAVCCLAILSAIDGLQLPDDFAMTGTIFPDGSIGVVGGIIEKIKAAAKQGKKRVFIPSYYRMIKDINEQLVDVVKLAEELNISLFQVENIEEAFALIHNKKIIDNKYIDIKKTIVLPRETEDLLKKEYFKYEDKINKIIPYFSDEDIDFIYSIYGKEFIFNNLFLEGKFLAAFEKIIMAYDIFTTAQKVLPVYKKWTVPLLGNSNKELEKIHNSNMEILKNSITKMYASYDNDTEKCQLKNTSAKEGNFSPIVAQLEDYENYYEEVGAFHTFNEIYSIEELELSNEAFEGYKKVEFVLRLYGECNKSIQKDVIDFYRKLAETVPPKYTTAVASEVENLFKISQLTVTQVAAATLNTEDLDHDIISYCYTAIATRDFALNYHDDVTKYNHSDYHIQVSLKLQVIAFVKATILLSLGYKNCTTDFEKYLIRNARNSALKNMAECISHNILCLDSIRTFQIAEATENSNDNLYEVLENYLYAGLYAKALLISFR